MSWKFFPAVAAIVAGVAVAQIQFTESSGTEQLITVTSPGDVRCQGGTPTGNPFAPCPPGVSGTFRGQQLVASEQTNDPRTSGLNYIVANGDVHADGAMNVWGTFRLEVAGGVWEGVWHGRSNAANRRSLSGVGHGSGGNVDGLQLLMDNVLEPGQFIATVNFRILTPGR